MNANDLIRYADAWNAHDIDTIMSMMTADCVFETAGGGDPWGTRFEGAAAVRQRFVKVWSDIPDARWDDAVHFVDGTHGCSAWTFRGTTPDGAALAVEGCDLFVFQDGAIWKKSTLLKSRR